MARHARFWRILFGLFASLPTGCFLGYDSRWGQQKQAQQHLAAARTPETLGASSRDGGEPSSRGVATRTLRVRLDASATYTAQVVDYERRFTDQLEGVNAVLAPSLGIRLEVVETRPFTPGSEEHTGELVERLRAADDGADVDWVIGLVGSVPRFEESFHELGVGEVVGKYMVLRALSNAAEYQAIEAGLSELSEADRDRLRRTRLMHKAATVLLHELGHTLGALHERDDTSIMNARYSKSIQHFSAAALDVMRLVLAHRNERGGLDDAGKKAVVSRLRADPAPWLPEDRNAAIARFGVIAARPSAPAAPLSTGAPAASAGLPPADEAKFEEARRLLDAGDPTAARRLAEPLFATYTNVHAVAELRCGIAMRQNLPWLETRKECAGLMEGMPGFH